MPDQANSEEKENINQENPLGTLHQSNKRNLDNTTEQRNPKKFKPDIDSLTKRLKRNNSQGSKILTEKINEICDKNDCGSNFDNENSAEEIDCYSTEFDDNWGEDFDLAEINKLDLELMQYCAILEIKRAQNGVIIKVKSLENSEITSCLITGVWLSMDMAVDNRVTIVGARYSGDVPYIVDNDRGFLILEPDIHVSPTRIVKAKYCMRRAVLSYRYNMDKDNSFCITGLLLHQLLEFALKDNIQDGKIIEKKLEQLLSTKENILKLYFCNIPMAEMMASCMEYVEKIVDCLKKYMPKEKTGLQSTCQRDKKDWKGFVDSVVDIEDVIYSTKYGMTGQIDATIVEKGTGQILPFEVKTGKVASVDEHKGQVILYTALMEDIGITVSSGLLLYLRDNIIYEVNARHYEKRDIIMLRNKIVQYLNKSMQIRSRINEEEKLRLDSENMVFPVLELPEPIYHPTECARCNYLPVCAAFARNEKMELNDKNPRNMYIDMVGNELTERHSDYLNHWSSLLCLEAGNSAFDKETKQFWRLKPFERELRGKAISYLVLNRLIKKSDCEYVHIFKRDITKTEIFSKHKINLDFTSSAIQTGDWVFINTEARFKITGGTIIYLSSEDIHVSLSKNLFEKYAKYVFHLDFYSSNSSTIEFQNLAALMCLTPRAYRLRQLIIDKKPPKISGQLPKTVVRVAKSIILSLSKCQQRAVLTVPTIEEYLLIKGLPGTGKTTTIIALIRLLVKLEKSVLLTSNTNSAVDNVCQRLLKHDIPFLRLGNETKIHSQVKYRSEAVLINDCKTEDDLKRLYEDTPVVAVTCYSAKHNLLEKRVFDICIVDESAQVLECLLIKPLLAAKTFVLVGDPDQLPPVVKNPHAVKAGMAISLFEKLASPNCTVTLDVQYRMNNIITNLANAVTYNGQLLCANDTVANAVLSIPLLKDLETTYKQDEWLKKLLSPDIETSAMVLDTGPVWSFQREDFSTKTESLLANLSISNGIREDERKCLNNQEASLILFIVKVLQEGGIKAEEIGIIAPYKLQVDNITKHMKHLKDTRTAFNEVEVNTVDQYQGRDKDVIILSCTRTRDPSKPKNPNEILEDKRRLTVAITRAKKKLIIVADVQTLNTYTPFNKLFQSINNNQIIKLEDGKDGFSWSKIL